MRVFRDLPPWGKKAISFVKVASVVGGALFALLAGALDLYSKYAEVKEKTVSSYETLAPAIQELQSLFTEHVQDTEAWSDGVDKNIDVLEAECGPLEARIKAMEETLHRLTAKHRGISAPTVSREPASVPKAWPDILVSGEREDLPAPARKPARYVPDKIEQAADYQNKREVRRCSPSDPLCGLD